jgi:hypothetical protein
MDNRSTKLSELPVVNAISNATPLLCGRQRRLDGGQCCDPGRVYQRFDQWLFAI